MNRTLTIVGASVRAAAQSARRAGFVVHAGDLFADLDLGRDCQATAVDDYPRGLASTVWGPQSGPWMYTGALENAPELVAEWSTIRRLLGNGAEVLRRARDPWLVSQALRESGLLAPKLATQGSLPPRDGRWLRKPRLSAAGAHIAHWNDMSSHAHDSDDCVFQKYIGGLPCSAVYVAARGRAVLLGVTRQLIGESWCGGSGFRYCGSIGPLRLPSAAETRFDEIGQCLAKSFELVGLFGVDMILNELGVWPVEINPRYTASAELFDWSCNISTIALHVDACQRGELPAAVLTPGHCCGKAILFANGPVTVGNVARRWLTEECGSWPRLADIPVPGSTLTSGCPIVTVFAQEDNEQLVMNRLKLEAMLVRDDLDVPLPSALG